MTPRDTTSSSSSLSGGLSRAALQALKDGIDRRIAGHVDGDIAVQVWVLKEWRAEVDALLTAPSAQQEGAEMHATSAEIDLEIEQMRLAACLAAALGNTPESAAQRIDRESPYWSGSYQTVCEAVDREMDLRARLQTLTGYVQHKDDCEAWPQFTSHFQQATKRGACTCGLADLLTPASAEEPEKLK